MSQLASRNNDTRSLRVDISRAKKRLCAQDICENFGQVEVRRLKDKYNPLSLWYGRKQADMIDAFEDWCMNYTGGIYA